MEWVQLLKGMFPLPYSLLLKNTLHFASARNRPQWYLTNNVQMVEP